MGGWPPRAAGRRRPGGGGTHRAGPLGAPTAVGLLPPAPEGKRKRARAEGGGGEKGSGEGESGGGEEGGGRAQEEGGGGEKTRLFKRRKTVGLFFLQGPGPHCQGKKPPRPP